MTGEIEIIERSIAILLKVAKTIENRKLNRVHSKSDTGAAKMMPGGTTMSSGGVKRGECVRSAWRVLEECLEDA